MDDLSVTIPFTCTCEQKKMTDQLELQISVQQSDHQSVRRRKFKLVNFFLSFAGLARRCPPSYCSFIARRTTNFRKSQDVLVEKIKDRAPAWSD